MKLQSILKGKKIKGAFTKNGDFSPENFDKNDGLSVIDCILDPQNLYPVKIKNLLLAQAVIIPAKEALFFAGFLIENGELTSNVYFIACGYEEDEEAFYCVDSDSPYNKPFTEIYFGLKNGETQNKPVSMNSSKGKKVAFGFMTAFYALLLTLGVIGFSVLPEYKAYSAIIALLSPMWLVYFFFHDPFEKETSVGILVASIVLAVGACIGHLLLFKNILLCILLVLFYVFQFVGYAKFCKDKSSLMFVLIGIGSIIAVPLAIAAVIVGAIIVFIKFILSFFGDTEFGQAFKRGYRGESESESVYEIYDEMGYKRTLKRVGGYNPSREGDRYIDDVGSYWYTTDNGQTFERE